MNDNIIDTYIKQLEEMQMEIIDLNRSIMRLLKIIEQLQKTLDMLIYE